jgi:signal transduction histidine kinase
MLRLAPGSVSRRILIECAVIVFAGADAVGSILDDDVITTSHIVLGVVAVTALLFRKRAPYVVFALTLPALAASSVVLAALAALFTVAERKPPRYLMIVCSAAFFVCFTALWDRSYSGVDTVLDLVYATIFTAAPVWLGMLISVRTDLSEKLAEIEQARRHEEELVIERAVAQERSALAREMHDVVSHQVSLIAVQAGALQVTATDAASSEAARTIRTLSVRTLDELREMVDVLRPTGRPSVELAPQPGIDDIESLVAGSRVPTVIDARNPAGFSPPAPVQRAVYRTVQEGLTNIAKHAPGASATLALRIDPREVSVTLTNTKPTRAPEQLPSSQHGLLGLRERAELLGGSLRAEETAGGYQLSMTLPVT